MLDKSVDAVFLHLTECFENELQAKAKLLIFKRNLNVDVDAEPQCKYKMKQEKPSMKITVHKTFVMAEEQTTGVSDRECSPLSL